MIVLRLSVGGRVRTLESPRPRLALGSGPDADVVAPGASWRELEGVLVHHGTTVHLERLDGGSTTLRVGDSTTVGGATLTLIGLLPLAEPATTGIAPAPPPAFGGYGDEAVSGRTFTLAEEREVARPAATPAAPPPTPAPPGRADGAPEPGKPETPASPPQVPTPHPPPPPSFGAELVQQLRHAPYLTLSVALHALILLVFGLLQTGPDAGGHHGRDGTIALANLDPAELEQRMNEKREEESPVPEPDLPPIPEPKLPEPERAESSTATPEEEPDLEPLPDPQGMPIPIGLNPSVQAVGSADSRRRPTPRKVLQQRFTKGDDADANHKAAAIIRADLGMGTGRKGDPFASLERKDILVVDGSFDKIGRVLDALQLPFITVTPLSLTFKNAPDLSQHKVIFWNCGESLPPNRIPLVARKLKTFVKEGGYLFTTDWGVATILMAAFPGYLTTTGPEAPLPESVVEIGPAPGHRNDPLLKGVFQPGVQGLWWLEQASFDVKVLEARKVDVLITSRDLEQLFKRSPVVAATFRHGRGRVLHVMGHYYQEEGNLAGTIASHRLALNFVLDRLMRRP